MAFHWSLTDCRSSQVSRTLLSILADLTNTAVWMLLIHSLIFNSSSLFTKRLGTIPSIPITIAMSHLIIWISDKVLLIHPLIFNSSSPFTFGDHSKNANYNCYLHYPLLLQPFLVLRQGPNSCLYFLFYFYSVVC